MPPSPGSLVSRVACRMAYLALLLVSTVAPASAQTLQWLGHVTTGELRNAVVVSADGATVAFPDPSSGGQVRVWTATSSQTIGVVGKVAGLSGDGSTAVGFATGVYSFGHAWRWTTTGGLTVIPTSSPTPPPGKSSAEDISIDGRVAGIVGIPFVAPAYWETTGSQTELEMQGEEYQVWGISPDGSVIVGARLLGICGQQCAMRWVESGGGWTRSAVGTNPSAGGGIAIAASSGGGVILAVDSTNLLEGWTWSAATGAQLLDRGGADDAVAFGLDATGSLIGGYTETGNIFTAAVWEGPGAPVRTLEQVLLDDHGFSIGGDTLRTVTDISASGLVIVGTGVPAGTTILQAFRLELPAPAVPALGPTAVPLAVLGLLVTGRAVLRRR